MNTIHTGASHYHAQRGLPDKGHNISYLVVLCQYHVQGSRSNAVNQTSEWANTEVSKILS